MQGVFNPNILIYHPPNFAEGLHFSAFHYITCRDIQHSPDAVAPGLCWADRGGWNVFNAEVVPVCKV